MNDPAQLPLRDIHLPDPVSWWPPAAGWWLLALLVLLAAAGVWWWLKASATGRRSRRLRRVARIELRKLEAAYRSDEDPARLLRGVSILLRRVAMSFAPPGAVAGLCGDDWIRWLKSTDAKRMLDARTIVLLTSGPYMRDPDTDLRHVIERLGRWLDSFDPEAAPR